MATKITTKRSLYVRQTPVPTETAHQLSDKLMTILGELTPRGGEVITIGPEKLEWFEGLRAGVIRILDERDKGHLMTILDHLRANESVDLWFEYD